MATTTTPDARIVTLAAPATPYTPLNARPACAAVRR
jgi:hypothetical protein